VARLGHTGSDVTRRIRRRLTRREGAPTRWRLAVPIVAGLAGLLAVTSAVSSRGTDLRGGRHSDIPSLVASQRHQLAVLRRQQSQLESQVDVLKRVIAAADPARIEAESERLVTPAGLTALQGAGLVVTLDDAPADEPVPHGTNPNALVVHQQDLQAVINALWAGGADGISLQGQRIISTTGVKCVGNTVVLQGVPYAPPYRIVAVGRATQMIQGLLESKDVKAYIAYTKPPYHLGWSLVAALTTEVPAYTGSLTLRSAKVLP
jgi:uncharacterized protein YlxW (UPF0749 family)